MVDSVVGMDEPTALRIALRADLTEAMRSGDRVRTALVRSLAAALANAEAVPSAHGAEPVPFGSAEAPRRRLGPGEARGIVARELAERVAVIDEYRRHEDGSHLERLGREIELLEGYLASMAVDPPA